MNAPRYELFKWLDMVKFEPVYGVRLRERGRWLYMGERGLPCVTYDEHEALMFMDFLRLSHDDFDLSL